MKVLLRVAAEARRYQWTFAVAGACTLLLTVFQLLAPWLMTEMTSLVAAGLDEAGLRRIILLAIQLLGLYFACVWLRFLGHFLPHKAAWNLVAGLRVRVYDKLSALSMDYYRSHLTGDLVSRTVADTATFELLYAHLVPESITNFIIALGVTGVLLTVNWKLALLTCIPIPLIVLSGRILIKKIRPCFRVTAQALGELSAQLQDNYSGMQEIQAFGRQRAASQKVEEKARHHVKFMLKALRMNNFFRPGVEFLTALGRVIVVGFGGYLAYMHELSVEDIVAFLLYLALFYAPVTQLADLLEQMQQALAGAERVIEVLDAPETIRNMPGAPRLENVKGALALEHVSFSYQNGVPILEDISFAAAPGEMIAVVGATGVGKSTLAQLIARFYDPTAGTVRLDGRDLRTVDLGSLHQNVAMVLQETFLFSGTIDENIAFARPGAPRDEIEKAARIARIHDEILAMPDGYATVVGERGARLSGGQKQRIAIARAILSNAPVLILDEATASVDVETEAHIQQAVTALAGTRTIIVITHRLSTVRRADCILVFQKGRVVQRGSHGELAAVPGPYADMYSVQETGIRS